MNLALKILVNIAAIFVLVFLISLPTVFSVGFFKFDPQVSWHGFQFMGQKSHFANYLEIKEKEVSGGLSFNLTVTCFPQKEAFYKEVLAIKNDSDQSRELAIEKIEGDAQIFFARGDEKTGLEEIKLAPKETIGVNVLVQRGGQKEEKKEVNFLFKE